MSGGTCRFSHQGTFGHECGKPAVLAGPKPNSHTVSGIYWCLRCRRCSEEPGIDNWGIGPWVPFDPSIHFNVWKPGSGR